MSSSAPLSLVWLRRDLRLHDHHPLAQALGCNGSVQPVFVLDTEILKRFSNPEDRRLSFLARALCRLHETLRQRGGGLLLLHGDARQVIPKLAAAVHAGAVYAGEDAEPAARARDAHVGEALKPDTQLRLVCDHLLHPPQRVMKEDGTPYRVFTPYSKAWRQRLTADSFEEAAVMDAGRYASYDDAAKCAHAAGLRVLDPSHGENGVLDAIGYRYREDLLWPVEAAQERLHDFADGPLDAYHQQRDFVANAGTSRLSPYLRFGLISVRECARVAARRAAPGADCWLKELVWRDFYAMILYHYPESAQQEFQRHYRGTLNWNRNAEWLHAWQNGMTGYPLVDAAMRQLQSSGWMHNRARMIVASFFTKDLRLDWRLGEEYFAQWLMDYDMASNVGGWQWAASTGTDAQPWFRVFNPVLQSQKFDPQGEYIRRFVPELAHLPDKDLHEPWKSARPANYPLPIVDHDAARKQALEMFRRVQEVPSSEA